MITKLYGMFTFKRLDNEESDEIHIVIARNISLGLVYLNLIK